MKYITGTTIFILWILLANELFKFEIFSDRWFDKASILFLFSICIYQGIKNMEQKNSADETALHQDQIKKMA